MIHCSTRRDGSVFLCMYHKATHISLVSEICYGSSSVYYTQETPKRLSDLDHYKGLYPCNVLTFAFDLHCGKNRYSKTEISKENGFTYWPNYKSVISRFCENKCESCVFIDESRCFPKIDEIQSADSVALLNLCTQMNKHMTQQYTRSFGQIRLLTGSRSYLNYRVFFLILSRRLTS